MVSFWPFKGDDTSAESFEKALSQLSSKIAKASSQTDRIRQQQRRYKVLWTLYTTFAYILVAAILTLVTGWQRWNYPEYTAVCGGPVLIYSVRLALDAYFNYRLSRSENHLADLNKQRDATIERLKQATKYNSTQQMLEKYGGSSPSKSQPSPDTKAKSKLKSDGNQHGALQASRTGIAPPPTANIPGRQPPQIGLPIPQGLPESAPRPANGVDGIVLSDTQNVAGEEFAPNAFPSPSKPRAATRTSSQYAADGAKWYDRLLDVVLGEDETSAKNRIVLICQRCKLVNGQAPPGARTLEDVGTWRCSQCHAWNGVESEEKKILTQISQDADIMTSSDPASTNAGPGSRPVTSSGEHCDGAE